MPVLVPRVRPKLRCRYWHHATRLSAMDATDGVDLELKYITSYIRTDGYYAELFAFCYPPMGDIEVLFSVIEREGVPHYEVSRMMGHECNVFLDGEIKVTMPRAPTNEGYYGISGE